MYKKTNNFNQMSASRVRLHEVVTDFNVNGLSLSEQRESLTTAMAVVDKELNQINTDNVLDGKGKKRSKRRKALVIKKMSLIEDIKNVNAKMDRCPIPRTFEGHFYDVAKETLDKFKYVSIFDEAKRRAMLDSEQEIKCKT